MEQVPKELNISRLDNVKLTNVIMIEAIEGSGTMQEPCKKIIAFYTLSGKYIGKITFEA